ncbi:HU family DNA-binding protein [Vibrio sp. Vb5031]|uniref:Integration host factor subunit alpha n=1 Tax=Vibrio hepatarius TaxID=171383 RepID=A0A0M0HY02_9VIBR|nr:MULTISPECIES: HU family DNA-binding protein [Vibrio]KOO06944.1 integration host factor subunit alpha [Vibrio hepatarius]MCA2421847.1 HU family DNA-binding protein [Vibrio alginolyticus]MCA2446545.1 HU family DNA-binding protein [Vibrio alginolyticus]MCR9821591.1 HU family DNA-binding protein [Vibrio parahaemolyticus]MDF5108326.1 HU family DNA-binding protein [Vibrio parahaemolyticus]
MTLTKRDLGRSLQEVLPVASREAESLVTDIFQQISDELQNGNEVSLHGFGQFRILEKNSRPGRNPKTGEACDISARKVCVLKPGTQLKISAKNNAKKMAVCM